MEPSGPSSPAAGFDPAATFSAARAARHRHRLAQEQVVEREHARGLRWHARVSATLVVIGGACAGPALMVFAMARWALSGGCIAFLADLGDDAVPQRTA